MCGVVAVIPELPSTQVAFTGINRKQFCGEVEMEEGIEPSRVSSRQKTK
jgi:hypothetical protein